jgi:hypothetical protein
MRYDAFKREAHPAPQQVPPPQIHRHRSEIDINRHARKIQSPIAEPQPIRRFLQACGSQQLRSLEPPAAPISESFCQSRSDMAKVCFMQFSGAGAVEAAAFPRSE